MKIFKRPMFRKGGNVGNGIMTGIRDNFENGTPMPSEQYKEVFEKYTQPATDPITRLLIEGGLRGLGETRGGSTLANLALAFEPGVSKAFDSMEDVQAAKRDIEVAGVGADIEYKMNQDKMNLEQKLANLDLEFRQAEGDKNRQNQIDKEREKTKGELEVLQFKLDNPDADPAKKGVIPSFETQVLDLTKVYADSPNLELAKAPDFHANKITKFNSNAPEEILSRYKGIVYYDYDNKGNLTSIPPKTNAGDVIYDPGLGDFFIVDNQGETIRLNPLSYEIMEE